MDIFDPIIKVFQFIYTLLESIISGIYGVIEIFESIISLINNITKILPNPLYGTLYSFLGLYVVIFTYKIFRKG